MIYKTIADDDKEEEWECETCMKLVPANQFREHKGVCLEESFQVIFPSKTITHQGKVSFAPMFI